MLFTADILNFKTALGKLWLAGTVGVRRRPFNKETILSSDIEALVNALTNTKDPLAPRLSGTFLMGLCAILKQKCHFFQTDLMDLLRRLYSNNKITDLALSEGAGRKKRVVRHAETAETILAELDQTLEKLNIDGDADDPQARELLAGLSAAIDDTMLEDSLQNPQYAAVSLFTARDEDLLLPESPLWKLTQNRDQESFFDPLADINFDADMDMVSSQLAAEAEERHSTTPQAAVEPLCLLDRPHSDEAEESVEHDDNDKSGRSEELGMSLNDVFASTDADSLLTGVQKGENNNEKSSGVHLRQTATRRHKMVIDSTTSLPDEVVAAWRSAGESEITKGLITYSDHQRDIDARVERDNLTTAVTHNPLVATLLKRALLPPEGLSLCLDEQPRRMRGKHSSPTTASTEDEEFRSPAKRQRLDKSYGPDEVDEVNLNNEVGTPPAWRLAANDDRDNVLSEFGDERLNDVERLRGIFNEGGGDSSDLGAPGSDMRRDRRSSFGEGGSRRSSIADPGDPMADLIWQTTQTRGGRSEASSPMGDSLVGNTARGSVGLSPAMSPFGSSMMYPKLQGPVRSQDELEAITNTLTPVRDHVVNYSIETWRYRTFIERRVKQNEAAGRGGSNLTFSEIAVPGVTDRLTAARSLYHLLVLTAAGDTKVSQKGGPSADIIITTGRDVFTPTHDSNNTLNMGMGLKQRNRNKAQYDDESLASFGSRQANGYKQGGGGLTYPHGETESAGVGLDKVMGSSITSMSLTPTERCSYEAHRGVLDSSSSVCSTPV